MDTLRNRWLQLSDEGRNKTNRTVLLWRSKRRSNQSLQSDSTFWFHETENKPRRTAISSRVDQLFLAPAAVIPRSEGCWAVHCSGHAPVVLPPPHCMYCMCGVSLFFQQISSILKKVWTKVSWSWSDHESHICSKGFILNRRSLLLRRWCTWRCLAATAGRRISSLATSRRLTQTNGPLAEGGNSWKGLLATAGSH